LSPAFGQPFRLRNRKTGAALWVLGATATWVGTEWPWAKLLNTLDFSTRSGHTDAAAATVALQ
jgi:hypothetical protein